MKKMLLVEDDKFVVSIYRNKFLAEGFDVSVAGSGESAIESLKQGMPDLMLLDLMLPGINGVEVIKYVRAQPNGKNVGIIVFSNSYLGNLIKQAWTAGANKCLTKYDCTPRQVIEIASELNLATEASRAPATGAVPAATGKAVQNRPHDDLRDSLSNSSGQIVADLRQTLQSLSRADVSQQNAQLLELYRKVHSLASNAGLAGFLKVTQVCSAAEALLKELESKPDKLSASAFRTLAQALDLLPSLFADNSASSKPLVGSMILVLDDEKFSRQAVLSALARANLRGIALENPSTAVEVSKENAFDLMFLDVNMPGINGFDVCTQLRATPKNASTPVVFVTSSTDFETRKRSILSGGSDLIAKPFLLMELALKAVTYLLRGQDSTTKPPVSA